MPDPIPFLDPRLLRRGPIGPARGATLLDSEDPLEELREAILASRENVRASQRFTRGLEETAGPRLFSDYVTRSRVAPTPTDKRFLKTSISVDTRQQYVTGLKISQHPIHVVPHAEKLLRQCHRTRKSDLYVMDKGYDSGRIHELIRDTIHSYSIIPVRTRKRK